MLSVQRNLMGSGISPESAIARAYYGALVKMLSRLQIAKGNSFPTGNAGEYIGCGSRGKKGTIEATNAKGGTGRHSNRVM